jgi:hypothetical protein
MSQGVSVVGDDLDNIFYGDEPDEPALPRKKVEYLLFWKTFCIWSVVVFYAILS